MNNIHSLRLVEVDGNFLYVLFTMYEFGKAKYSNLSNEELEEFFCKKDIALRSQYPIASNTLKYKGNLRISWALDIKHNKNIDLIFFPEDNPYINYAVLFAKDFPKTIDKEAGIDRELSDIKIPYNINYDFVKEILAQSNLSKSQQERFFEMRFGSVFIPIEVEFEWYVLNWYSDYSPTTIGLGEIMAFTYYDECLKPDNAAQGGRFLALCLGIIKSYKLLSSNTFNNEFVIQLCPKVLTPLPTAALAITQTNINDYLVNVRDKPNSKEGKIVTQLLSQYLSPALIEPKFQKLQEKNGWGEHTTEHFMLEELEEHRALKQAYYEKEKQNLINPLNADEYLILVWNIEPNEWAKVWILRMIRDEDYIISENEKIYFKGEEEESFEWISIWGYYDNDIYDFINGSYSQTFLESPSSLKLYEGYIHTSGLQYLAPFSENYIQR